MSSHWERIFGLDSLRMLGCLGEANVIVIGLAAAPWWKSREESEHTSDEAGGSTAITIMGRIITIVMNLLIEARLAAVTMLFRPPSAIAEETVTNSTATTIWHASNLRCVNSNSWRTKRTLQKSSVDVMSVCDEGKWVGWALLTELPELHPLL